METKIIAKCITNIEPWTNKVDNRLEVGKCYEVDDLHIGSWQSEVYFKEFKSGKRTDGDTYYIIGDGFNTVMFEFYRDGEEIDIVDEYRT